VPGIAGGANWGGAGFDPETGVLYVPSRTDPTVITLAAVDPKQGNMRYVRAPLGTGAGLERIEGLSIFKPPYSRITAIDLNTGEHRWMSPIGDGPRDHPLLKGLNVPPLGERLQMINVLVTRTLVFVGVIPVANAQPADAEERRKLIYVFEKTTGTPLHAIELNAFSAAAPMTYTHGGKQYIVVAAGSGPTSELIALTLPTPTAE
jgi:quinoprotein glucose dehydrogenase